MRILIVDDHPLVRKGIASILFLEKDVHEIKEAENIEEAIDMMAKFSPEITLIDLNLGRQDGLEIVNKARAKGMATKFIVLTSSSKREDFLRAREAGVDGYILKEAFAEDILYALRIVLRGKKFIDPEVIQYQTSDIRENSHLDELTPRERDVLTELGKGLSNFEIGKQLFISEHTVKKHVSNILSKLELNHRTQAALFVNNSINI
ncbi:two component transcriptional regulator, LuxR family [Alkaliphilus metalliredigens QYMF]|uniref:Stage 0 sporulation protein A homolog n=1 Tax=Alkaliphilus metalliredigens (strain QYMF) TaxID=293826 RepID=A6TKJ8_ALKMQ|nr:response regulator transcription factor [Alkaliphilus metalliredigens]ABR46716.1 two component transcriptional regulator, LuxR family [Alkaliphilus metalliredigens QYMF]